MKEKSILSERIRRVTILFKELGYEIFEIENDEDAYSAGCSNDEDFQFGFLIDSESRFLEISFTFSFAPELSIFIKERLESMLKISYEYGCYFNVHNEGDVLLFSAFSKIYYVGLNYHALKETVRDFKKNIDAIKELLSIDQDAEEEEKYGSA